MFGVSLLFQLLISLQTLSLFFFIYTNTIHCNTTILYLYFVSVSYIIYSFQTTIGQRCYKRFTLPKVKGTASVSRIWSAIRRHRVLALGAYYKAYGVLPRGNSWFVPGRFRTDQHRYSRIPVIGQRRSICLQPHSSDLGHLYSACTFQDTHHGPFLDLTTQTGTHRGSFQPRLTHFVGTLTRTHLNSSQRKNQRF